MIISSFTLVHGKSKEDLTIISGLHTHFYTHFKNSIFLLHWYFYFAPKMASSIKIHN